MDFRGVKAKGQDTERGEGKESSSYLVIKESRLSKLSKSQGCTYCAVKVV